MLVIRLSHFGRKGERRFRVVVKEKRSRRDGTSVETLGWFEKKEKGQEHKELNKERYTYWVSQGAIPSPTVKKLFS
jgi:small subunit ribosomal protein S16